MKIFTIHAFRNVFAVVIALGIGYVAYTVNPKSVEIPKAQAAATALTGYAWSDTVGWISFNCTDDSSCGTSNYSVKLDPSTGNFSGQAWSSAPDTNTPPQGGVGWISFDRAVTGNPPGAPYQTGISSDPIAKVDTITGSVTGWARALAGCEVTPGVPVTSCASTSAGAAAGGWDGWIKLNGVTVDPAGKFSGYAWGGADTTSPSGDCTPGGVCVIGWIKFAASSNIPADSDGAACSGVSNDYTNSSVCKYGVKGPTLSPICVSTLDCTGVNVCNGLGACVPPGGPCPNGNVDCGAGQLCNPTLNQCININGPCSVSSDCVGGQVCPVGGGFCMNLGSCNSNADCTSSQTCNLTTHLCVNKPKTTFWQF